MVGKCEDWENGMIIIVKYSKRILDFIYSLEKYYEIFRILKMIF